MSSNEKKESLEEILAGIRTWIIIGVIGGLFIAGTATGILSSVVMGIIKTIGSVIEFVYFDVLDNERQPTYGTQPLESKEERDKRLEKEIKYSYMIRALGLKEPLPKYEHVQAMYELAISDIISGRSNESVAKLVVEENGFAFWMIRHENYTIKYFEGSYKDMKGNFTVDRVILP